MWCKDARWYFATRSPRFLSKTMAFIWFEHLSPVGRSVGRACKLQMWLAATDFDRFDGGDAAKITELFSKSCFCRRINVDNLVLPSLFGRSIELPLHRHCFRRKHTNIIRVLVAAVHVFSFYRIYASCFFMQRTDAMFGRARTTRGTTTQPNRRQSALELTAFWVSKQQ